VAIHHASSGEVIDIRPLGTQLRDETTKALYKTNHLEVFRVVLPAGKQTRVHKVDGELTVQCLEGQVEFAIEGTKRLMREGDLVCLAGGEHHALKAIDDSSVLVTLLLHGA
jgi:quercetin dioxygenase-like cupin family protein